MVFVFIVCGWFGNLLAGYRDQLDFFGGVRDAQRGSGLAVLPLECLSRMRALPPHRLIAVARKVQAFVARVVNDARHAIGNHSLDRLPYGGIRGSGSESGN